MGIRKLLSFGVASVYDVNASGATPLHVSVLYNSPLSASDCLAHFEIACM